MGGKVFSRTLAHGAFYAGARSTLKVLAFMLERGDIEQLLPFPPELGHLDRVSARHLRPPMTGVHACASSQGHWTQTVNLPTGNGLAGVILSDRKRHIAVLMNGVFAAVSLLSVAQAAGALDSAEGPPVKLAIFDFELDDLSPAAAYLNKATSAATTLQKVTQEAREQLLRSGRYQLVDVSHADAPAAVTHTLRNCEGCEAAIALKLGAQQSLLGIVRRATQTDYYVAVVIRDALTSKLVNEQEANFAGDESGWPTGVRMLIKHQVLVTPEPDSPIPKPP